jgi:hypothetical protein
MYSLIFLSHIHTEQRSESDILKQSELSISTQSVSMKCSQISYNELVIEKKIGVGSYGKVCVGTWNGASVALKFCRKKGKLDDFINEIKLMM